MILPVDVAKLDVGNQSSDSMVGRLDPLRSLPYLTGRRRRFDRCHRFDAYWIDAYWSGQRDPLECPGGHRNASLCQRDLAVAVAVEPRENVVHRQLRARYRPTAVNVVLLETRGQRIFGLGCHRVRRGPPPPTAHQCHCDNASHDSITHTDAFPMDGQIGHGFAADPRCVN